MIGRRDLIGGAALLAAGMTGVGAARAAGGLAGLPAALARIERERGGRLGVAVLDTRTGERAGQRGEERFPMASTFKLLVAAAVLSRVERGEERLDRRVRYDRSDFVAWSPVAEAPANLRDGMTVASLVEAMMTISDNTATNLLLASIGGPAGLTAFLRGTGDAVTRSDRDEPAMSEGRPGDPRDTTSPAAFLATMRALTLGDVLSPASRERLVLQMKANQTGAPLLRARLPAGWIIADRTGAAGHRTRNVVGLIWPARQAEPVFVTVFLTEGPEQSRARDAVLAEVGAALYAALGAPPA
jgi:beta-lactamase class A